MIDNRRMCQSEFIREYTNENRPKFNPKLFERNNQDIIDKVSQVILSCERDKYFTLKVLSIRSIVNYEEIYDTLREHEENRRKKGQKENIYDYINLKDSDIMLLEVKYLVRKNGVERMKINGKEQNVENPEQVLQVLIALPRFVNKYYFRLSGNYYVATTQIVDGSTYNNSTTNNAKCDNVTLKSLFMSVRIFRMFREAIDLNTTEKMRNILYTSIIFNNHVNAMLYIFAKYGYYATLEFFGLDFGLIRLSYDQNPDPNLVCFKKHNICISCNREIFMREPIIQSLCMTIYDAIGKDTKLEEPTIYLEDKAKEEKAKKDAAANNIYNPDFWLKTLGAAFRNASVDKGLSALDSLEYIYDNITRESIRLPDNMKENIYQVLRWLLCDFSALRAKDNTDVSIKKMRIAEYIAHFYATKLTKGIYRITDLGKKVKLKQIISAVYTSPMYIINGIINMSNLVSYVDMVSDNDAIAALKFTYKGISGLGEDGSSVQPIYRFVDPSVLGILDPDTSSNSDPGMTGLICPLTDVYGDRFTDYMEPNTWNEVVTGLRNDFTSGFGFTQAYHIDQPTDFSQYDYIKNDRMRKIIDNDRLVCPIKDLDGIIDYSTNDETPLREVKEKKSLFTIIDKDDNK